MCVLDTGGSCHIATMRTEMLKKHAIACGTDDDAVNGIKNGIAYSCMSRQRRTIFCNRNEKKKKQK